MQNLNLTEWPGRDVFSDGLPVMGCIWAAEIIPMELKSKIEMLINADLYLFLKQFGVRTKPVKHEY